MLIEEQSPHTRPARHPHPREEFAYYETLSLVAGQGFVVEPHEAPFVPILFCPDHGVQPVTGTYRYNTGYDPGETDVAACGLIDVDGIF